MARIDSRLNILGEEFRRNRDGHLKQIEAVRDLEARIRANSAKALPKFRERGQLLPRERIDLLLDRGTPFLELMTLAGYKMHDDDGEGGLCGGNVIAGIGTIAGTRCMLVANDAGIKGGANTPMGVEKVLRAQAIAMENKLPYVQLVESAGANLLYQAEMFVKGGRTFANEAKMSAMGLPVISVVHGSSTAGGAYQPGLSDHVIVVRGRSKIFLAGPPLLKAATGEIATDEELGGAEMHFQISGLAEHMAEDDRDAIRLARELLDRIGWGGAGPVGKSDAAPPAYDPEEILGLVPLDYAKPYDVRELIARLVDQSDYTDVKGEFGPGTVTGFARLLGHDIGIIGNNGPIDTAGAQKAAYFIQLCCQSNIPIVYLQNTTGYMVGREAEAAGIVKHGSKMIQAVANATVPQFTFHIGASFGAGNYGMCGRAYDPRFIFAWPNNRIGVMGGAQAAKVMSIITEEGQRRQGKEPDRAALDKMEEGIKARYDAESTALFATARLWDDGLIDPRDTRTILGLCLDMARDAGNRRLRPSSFGVARM